MRYIQELCAISLTISPARVNTGETDEDSDVSSAIEKRWIFLSEIVIQTITSVTSVKTDAVNPMGETNFTKTSYE